MGVVKLDDGSLWVHSPVDLDDQLRSGTSLDKRMFMSCSGHCSYTSLNTASHQYTQADICALLLAPCAYTTRSASTARPCQAHSEPEL